MRLKSVNIQGYRPLKNFEAQLQPLEIIDSRTMSTSI